MMAACFTFEVWTPWGKQMIFQGRSTSTGKELAYQKAIQPWFASTECDKQPSIVSSKLSCFILLLSYFYLTKSKDLILDY